MEMVAPEPLASQAGALNFLGAVMAVTGAPVDYAAHKQALFPQCLSLGRVVLIDNYQRTGLKKLCRASYRFSSKAMFAP
jgi:hypothetical protein